MKKVLAVLIACIMVLSLAACNKEETKVNDSTQNKTDTTDNKADEGDEAQVTDLEEVVEVVAGSSPDEKILLGVEIYDPTDSEFLELQDYFNYLAETMNVEFKYSEAIADADGEMKFIEDCAIAGAKGFIAYYNVTGIEQTRAVIDYDMYYWGAAEVEDVYSEYKSNPLYLGSVNLGDSDYESGKAMGEWVLEQGYDTVVYSNGGADFGVPMFVGRQNGFLDALKDSNVEVVIVSGFPGEQFFADQAAALGTEGLDAVCASFNGLDFWAQPIASAGLADTVKLATIGSLNQNYLDAFINGSVSLLASTNIQRFGLAVGMIANAVDGNADALKEDGLATNLAVSMWIIDNAEDCEELFNLQKNEKIYTVEDVMSVCLEINPDASATTLKDLVEKATLEN